MSLNIYRYISYFSKERRIARALRKYDGANQRQKHRICKFLEKNFIFISPLAKIGSNLILPHPHNIQIGVGCVIGNNVKIYHNVTLGQNHNAYPVIDDNVTIYPNACVFGDIIVGANSVIGAGAIVNKNVPPNTVVAGNPARVIKVIGK